MDKTIHFQCAVIVHLGINVPQRLLLPLLATQALIKLFSSKQHVHLVLLAALAHIEMQLLMFVRPVIPLQRDKQDAPLLQRLHATIMQVFMNSHGLTKALV